MPLTPSVGTGQIITPTWGNTIRDRTTQTFANKAELDTWVGPPDGSTAWTIAEARFWTRIAGVWYRNPDYGFRSATGDANGRLVAVPHLVGKVPSVVLAVPGLPTSGSQLVVEASTSSALQFRFYTGNGGNPGAVSLSAYWIALAVRMPGAVWQGEHGAARMDRYDVVCVHTIVGYAPAHAAHFSTATDGRIFQSRDTQFQSAANLDGNPRCIAIENADMPPNWNTADGHAVPDFTPAQVDAIASILRWCHETHGIPLAPCPDSKPSSRGVAYHRQGIDGNFAPYGYPGRVSGGEHWSSSVGKVCPGDRRIATLLGEILPLAAGTAPTELQGEESMIITYSNGSVWLAGGKLARIKSQTDLVALRESGELEWRVSDAQYSALGKAYGEPVG